MIGNNAVFFVRKEIIQLVHAEKLKINYLKSNKI